MEGKLERLLSDPLRRTWLTRDPPGFTPAASDTDKPAQNHLPNWLVHYRRGAEGAWKLTKIVLSVSVVLWLAALMIDMRIAVLAIPASVFLAWLLLALAYDSIRANEVEEIQALDQCALVQIGPAKTDEQQGADFVFDPQCEGWYWQDGDTILGTVQVLGPVVLGTLAERLRQGSLSPQALVWHTALGDAWKPLASVVQPAAHAPDSGTPSAQTAMTAMLPAQIGDNDFKGVKGWLLLLCVSLTLVAPASVMKALVRTHEVLEPYFTRFPALREYVLQHSLVSMGLLSLGVVAGIMLWTVKPGAVKLAQSFLIATLVYGAAGFVLIPSSQLPWAVSSALMEGALQTFIQSVLVFAVWMTYLAKSKRVKATYFSG